MKEDIDVQNGVVSLKQWVITLLLMCIPVVNFILLILWAFILKDTNYSKRNWARASLIFMVAGSVIAILISLLGLVGRAIS